MTRLT